MKLDDLYNDYNGQTITIGPTDTLTAPGGPYYINDTNGTTWQDHSSVTSIGTSYRALQVEGDANFKGDLKIEGVSLKDTLSKIQERLNILEVNPELESRWSKLKQLGEEYRAMEADLLDQEELLKLLRG